MYRLRLPITNHDFEDLYRFEEIMIPSRGKRLCVKQENLIQGAEKSRWRTDNFPPDSFHRRWRFRDGSGFFKTQKNRRMFVKKTSERYLDRIYRFHPIGELLEFAKMYLQFPLKIEKEEYIYGGVYEGGLMVPFVFWSETDRTAFKLWFIP